MFKDLKTKPGNAGVEAAEKFIKELRKFLLAHNVVSVYSGTDCGNLGMIIDNPDGTRLDVIVDINFIDEPKVTFGVTHYPTGEYAYRRIVF